MRTTKIVYTIIWLITILPLIFLNMHKIIVKKEDGKRNIKVVRLAIISILAILITSLLFTTYKVTIDYQPKLVVDRFVTTLSSNSFDDAKNKFSNLVAEDMDLNSFEEIYNNIPKDGGRYQLGEKIIARFFAEKEFFPSENIDKSQEDVVCIFIRIDETGSGNSDDYKHYILRLQLVDDIKWKIDAIIEASDEALAYADRYALLKNEHAGTWYYF